LGKQARESNGPLGIQPKQQANVFANAFATSAADPTRFVRGVSHDIANTNHLILIAFITGNSSLEPLIEGLCAQIHVNLR